MIKYSYTGANDGTSCTDGSTVGLTRSVYTYSTDSSPEGTWTYGRTVPQTGNQFLTVTDPGNNQTVIDFQGIYETRRRNYSGTYNPNNPNSGLLQTTETCYGTSATPPSFPCYSTAVSSGFTEVFSRLEFPSPAKNSETDTFYNSSGLVQEVDEYDFWTGGTKPPSPNRKTLTTWTNLGSSINRPTLVTVTDGSGNTVAKTGYTYDEGMTGVHGDLTTQTSYSSATSSLSTHYTYNSNGLMATSKDAGGNITNYSYTNCNNSFLTSITLPVNSLSTSQTWNCGGGVITQTTDANSNQTNYTYGDPNHWQLTKIDGPTISAGTPEITYAYSIYTASPFAPVMVTQTQKVDASQTTKVQSSIDGLGRVYQTFNTSLTPSTEVDTAFDSFGRVYSVTNPYQSQSDPTYGKTYYGYDALGRLNLVTNPDGSTKQINSFASAVSVSDEGRDFAGHRVTRTTQYDGLGRMTSVCEITSGISWNGDTGSTCSTDISGSGFTTTYGYDLLNNLTSVAQGSMTTRTYQYDWLSRLTSVADPETGGTAGATTYSYNAAGDLNQRVRPAPNQQSYSNKVTTTYAYDGLHRITGITYSDGTTPNINYYYDTNLPWTQWATNVKGRLVEVDNQYGGGTGTRASSIISSYDAMGRIIQQNQQTPSISPAGYWLSASYDLAGDLLSSSNPMGNYTVSYTYNAARQLSGVTSTLTGTNYPATIVSGLNYNPLGQLASGTLGNGITLSRTYNNMGRLTYSNDGSVYSINSSTKPVAYYPDGNIQQANDSNGQWTYGYDDLNRLALASGPGDALNLLEWSQQIGQSPWTAESGATVIENDSSTTDPNNGTTATRVTATQASSDIYQIVPSETVSSGKTYTFSVWLKAPVSTQAAIGIDRCCGYDWEGTGTVNVSTTWQRYTFTHDGTWTGSSTVIAGIFVYGTNKYVWAWGAQLELGSTEGPYVVTTSSQATNGFTYNYDRYGNRWQQNGGGGPNPQYTFETTNVTNHIIGSGIQYDAMGNIINDGVGNTYSYDAEGRMISANTTTLYWYDAVGRRYYTNVGGSTPREFVYDVTGRMIAMSRTSPQTWDRGEIYAGGWHLASYVNSTTEFNHADWLGSVRVRTGPTGAVLNSYTSLPFGDCLTQNGGSNCNGTVGATPSHFTDQDRDSETGLDYFMFRQYSSVQGRWLRPDPAGLAAVNIGNPQTWNRYAYVENNPINGLDLLGLIYCLPLPGGGSDFTHCVDDSSYQTDPSQYPGYQRVQVNTVVTVSADSTTMDTSSFNSFVLATQMNQHTSGPGSDNDAANKSLIPRNAKVQFKVEPKATIRQWLHAAFDCLVSPDPLPTTTRITPDTPADQTGRLDGNSLDQSNTIYVLTPNGRQVATTGNSSPGLNTSADAAGMELDWAGCMDKELGGPKWWP